MHLKLVASWHAWRLIPSLSPKRIQFLNEIQRLQLGQVHCSWQPIRRRQPYGTRSQLIHHQGLVLLPSFPHGIRHKLALQHHVQ